MMNLVMKKTRNDLINQKINKSTKILLIIKTSLMAASWMSPY